MGALVETAVIAQSFRDPAPVYYARWKHGEVDLVTLDPTGRPSHALEIKWSDRYVDAPEQLAGLVRFARDNRLGRVTATTRTRFAERATGGVTIDMVPASVQAWLVGGIRPAQEKS